MALALYRRYRPDTFDGVVGQDHVTKPLSRALDEGKLTHAYLFSGPRGCGKTSSARILARCINCVEGPTSHPCGVCDSCRDLSTNGPGSIDVVEIDAASHGSVEDARELRERAGFAPARDRYKIFILDEAHMVTSNGFNALLKIVEEPPEHVMFIFATTEPDKVIGTIRSRTHHYPFRLVPPEIMLPYLEDICNKEGIEPEAGVLRLAMRAGGGSMRDTLSVLDQLMVGSVDGKITYADSVALLGFTPDSLISEAVDAVIETNGEKLYGVIEKVVTGGFDPRRFVEDLLAYVRDLLVLSIAGEQAESALNSGQSSQTMDDMRRQAQALNLRKLNEMAERINSALGSMVGTVSPRMRLELLAAQLLIPMNAQPLEGVQQTPALASSSSQAGAGRTSSPSQTLQSRQSQSPRARAKALQAQEQAAAEAVSVRMNAEISPQTSQVSQFSQSQQEPAQNEARVSVPDTAQNQQTGETSAERVTAEHASHEGAELDPAQAQEQWNAIVRSLPAKIQTVVDNEHIPHVELHQRGAHYRMILTFANPLSQHAFGLAVSSEVINGETSLQKILNAKLYERYNTPVLVAPAARTADGQTVTPMRNLSPAEQAHIKAQVAQMAAQAALAQVRTTWESSPLSHAHETKQEAESAHSDDSEVDRQEVDQQSRVSADDSVADSVVDSIANDYDPWAVSEGMSGFAEEENAPSDPTDSHVAQRSESSFAETAQEAEVEPVSTPEPPQDFDPWAHTETNHTYGEKYGSVESTTPLNSAESTSSESVTNSPVARMNSSDSERISDSPDTARDVSRETSLSGGASDMSIPASPDFAQPRPEVSAEDDNYSLDDDSIGSQMSMSVKAVSKMFNAKKTENFAADDERNPTKR